MTNIGSDRVERMAANLARRAKDGIDGDGGGREIVARETLPPNLEQAIANLEARVKVLEDKPERLIPSNSNEQIVIPRGVTDLVERVSNIETRISEAADQSDIDMLAEIIGDIGNAAITHAGVLSKRIDALEARVSNLPSDLLSEVGRAQAELKMRRT